MINIFNLFLTLFFFWMLLVISGENFSWTYIFIGLGVSILVSFFCWKVKIINKNSNFLFLHIGFYKHFIWIIISSAPNCIFMAFKAAFLQSKITPKIHLLSVEKINSHQLALLITTINLMAGILFISFKNNEIKIANFGSNNFESRKLESILETLTKINDNRLV